MQDDARALTLASTVASDAVKDAIGELLAESEKALEAATEERQRIVEQGTSRERGPWLKGAS